MKLDGQKEKRIYNAGRREECDRMRVKMEQSREESVEKAQARERDQR